MPTGSGVRYRSSGRSKWKSRPESHRPTCWGQEEIPMRNPALVGVSLLLCGVFGVAAAQEVYETAVDRSNDVNTERTTGASPLCWMS